MRGVLISLAGLALISCADSSQGSDVETKVDPNSVAGDFRGITGQVERIVSMPSEYVVARDVEIWLPPSYGTDSERRYPVLYMHDGQNLFDPEQSKYAGWDWGVDEAMTNLIAQGLVPEAIVVGAHSVDKTRNQDYFPERAGREYVDQFKREMPEFNTEDLNGNNYLLFLTKELKPYIDLNFRTQTGPEHTSIMGSSMGGLASLYAISEYPSVFGAAAMVSTHFPLGDGVLVDYFASNLPNPEMNRLYFDYGTETLDHNYEGYQDRMDAAVESAGYERGKNWTTRKYQGHDHSERAWRNRVHVPLQFLLAGTNVKGGEEK